MGKCGNPIFLFSVGRLVIKDKWGIPSVDELNYVGTEGGKSSANRYMAELNAVLDGQMYI